MKQPILLAVILIAATGMLISVCLPVTQNADMEAVSETFFATVSGHKVAATPMTLQVDGESIGKRFECTDPNCELIITQDKNVLTFESKDQTPLYVYFHKPVHFRGVYCPRYQVTVVNQLGAGIMGYSRVTYYSYTPHDGANKDGPILYDVFQAGCYNPIKNGKLDLERFPKMLKEVIKCEP